MRHKSATLIPVIIDVEASGFGSYSYPLEVGVVMPDGKRFCRLIQPAEQWTHWSEEAEALHGISRQMLKEKGLPVSQVCDELNRLLSDQTIFTDGWVVDFPWLIKLFEAGSRSMAFSVSPLEMVLSEYQMENWSAVREQILAQRPITRHRASSDAAFIQNVFLQTQQQQLYAVASALP